MSATSQSITSIPLNKLVVWDGNVRKTGATDNIEELQASIGAVGLLQSLVVRKTSRGKFAVIAGRRRYLALAALAEKGAINADASVPCSVVAGSADATEISLTENVVRAPMHPADQFVAFHDLVESGFTPADIAARFGLSEIAVKQRLKLARVSPAVFQAYRDGELTLEQVQAFTVSDDMQAQERVVSDLSEWNDGPDTIRDALTEHDIRASDPRARFVTLAAYEAAGGGIRRDLFAQDEDGVFLLDGELLDRLAHEKLEREAEAIKTEGWKWVDTVVQLDGREMDLRTRHPVRLPLSAEAAAEHKQLAEEYQTLFESAEEHDDATTERLDAIEARIEELDDTETAYAPDVLALAGAIVTIGHDGELKVMRGKVRPEDEPGEDSRTVSSGKTRPDYSAVLVQRLTEAKSAAIGASLSERPDIALAAIVHCLATRCFDSHERGQSVQITASVTHYRQESDGAAALERAREQWAERIPGDEAALWDWCLTQPQETLLELLAFCAALTVNAVQGKQDRPDCERLAHTDRLSVALGLDMKAWFTPNAANYFGHVSKPQILSAITEATARPAKRSWDKLKKSELAAVAEREVAGTGWLPQPLRF